MYDMLELKSFKPLPGHGQLYFVIMPFKTKNIQCSVFKTSFHCAQRVGGGVKTGKTKPLP